MKTQNVMKILIVEDNPDSLEGLKRLVEVTWRISDIDLQITGVNTLKEGLELANEANVTILDLDLPDSDMASTILAIDKFRPPVIVLTGTDDPNVIKSCVANGADHVFVKGSAIRLVSAIFESLQKDIVRRAKEREDQDYGR